MPTTRRIRIEQPQDSALTQGIADIKRELQLPLEFPPDVEAAAAKGAAHPRLPVEDQRSTRFELAGY